MLMEALGDDRWAMIVGRWINKVSVALLPQAVLLTDWKEIARLIPRRAGAAVVQRGYGRPPAAKNNCGIACWLGGYFFAAAAGLAA
jgi:hypothetical protein